MLRKPFLSLFGFAKYHTLTIPTARAIIFCIFSSFFCLIYIRFRTFSCFIPRTPYFSNVLFKCSSLVPMSGLWCWCRCFALQAGSKIEPAYSPSPRRCQTIVNHAPSFGLNPPSSRPPTPVGREPNVRIVFVESLGSGYAPSAGAVLAFLSRRLNCYLGPWPSWPMHRGCHESGA